MHAANGTMCFGRIQEKRYEVTFNGNHYFLDVTVDNLNALIGVTNSIYDCFPLWRDAFPRINATFV